MGLDMYLYRETYVKNWEHTKPVDKFDIRIKRGRKRYPDIDISKVNYIVEQVGYWRKANQIHQWFVDHIQNGVDECQRVYVPEEDLKRLYEIVCELLDELELVDGEICSGQTMNDKGEWIKIMKPGKVIKNPDLAIDLLPVQGGFFFGSTDYDNWYYQDLVDTKEILESIVNKEEDYASYYYQASW